MLYVEGLPHDDPEELLLVNELLSGYQVIAGRVPQAYIHKPQEFRLIYNEFYPRDKYTLITTGNKLSHGMQPAFIEHDTLKVHSFRMEPEPYIFDADLEEVVPDDDEGGDYDYGTVHVLDDKSEFHVDISNQGKDTITKDELKQRLKENKFDLLTNDLLYDPESRIVITASPRRVSALRVPKGWKPFSSDKPGQSVRVVKEHIPYGSTDINKSDVGKLDFDSAEVKVNDGAHIILPVLGNGTTVYKSESGEIFTEPLGSVIPDNVLNEGLKFIVETEQAENSIVLTNRNNLYDIKGARHKQHVTLQGQATKWPTPKEEFKLIAAARSEVQPYQEFTVFDHVAGITYGLNHYEIEDGRYEPADDELYETDVLEGQVKPLVITDLFYQANSRNIEIKLNEICKGTR